MWRDRALTTSRSAAGMHLLSQCLWAEIPPRVLTARIFGILGLVTRVLEYAIVLKLFCVILSFGRYIMLSLLLSSTYGHRSQKTEDPVRSPVLKLRTGRLVLWWVTTWEYRLLYVLHFYSLILLQLCPV